VLKFIAWSIVIYFGIKLVNNLLRLLSGLPPQQQSRSFFYKTYTYTNTGNSTRQQSYNHKEGEVVIEQIDNNATHKGKKLKEDAGEYIPFEEVK
jgi:hypothetical protein